MIFNRHTVFNSCLFYFLLSYSVTMLHCSSGQMHYAKSYFMHIRSHFIYEVSINEIIVAILLQ